MYNPEKNDQTFLSPANFVPSYPVIEQVAEGIVEIFSGLVRLVLRIFR